MKGYGRLDTIGQQAKRATELIKQLLDFSRASEMAMNPFDLVPVLKELTQLLERMLRKPFALS